MKYAAEVIGLLGQFPGQTFDMRQIINTIANGRELTPDEKKTVREGARLVLKKLVECRCITVTARLKQGGKGEYVWIGDKQYPSNDRANTVATKMTDRIK